MIAFYVEALIEGFNYKTGLVELMKVLENQEIYMICIRNYHSQVIFKRLVSMLTDNKVLQGLLMVLRENSHLHLIKNICKALQYHDIMQSKAIVYELNNKQQIQLSKNYMLDLSEENFRQQLVRKIEEQLNKVNLISLLT